MVQQDDDLEEEGDVLATPGSEKNRWATAAATTAGDEALNATTPNRAKRIKGNGVGVTLTLRDQEKVCINLTSVPPFPSILFKFIYT